MSGGRIRYHFGAIEEVAGAITSYSGRLDQTLNELYTQFGKLFAEDWQGQAGQACDDARRQWNKGATEIKAALGELAVKLRRGAQNMQERDKSIAAGM